MNEWMNEWRRQSSTKKHAVIKSTNIELILIQNIWYNTDCAAMQFNVVEIRWAGFLHGIASSYATNQTKLVWDKRRQGKQRQYMYLPISHHGLRCYFAIKTEIRSLEFFITRFSMKWNNLNKRIRTLNTINDYLLHCIPVSLFIGLCDQALARLTFGGCYTAKIQTRLVIGRMSFLSPDQ